MRRPSLISRWFHHRAWRWIIFRARWWQWTLAGLPGWWLIAWLLFLPWATTIEEPFFGNVGLWQAITSSTRHAIEPACVTAALLATVPLLGLLAAIRDRRSARLGPPNHWRVRVWFAAPWMLLPFILPPILWLWLSIARSQTLDDTAVVPPDIVWRGLGTFLMPALLSVALLLAMKLAVLIAAIVITQLNWRDRLMTTHECSQCAYDLSTLPQGTTCPECGTPSPPWPPHEEAVRPLPPQF
ncbi:MAG TPA: hypothetical protein VK157_07905 [Phycisphaerales bacterium]|nr:hypothetical protein [Phycisphaerales bacterium]